MNHREIGEIREDSGESTGRSERSGKFWKVYREIKEVREAFGDFH